MKRPRRRFAEHLVLFVSVCPVAVAPAAAQGPEQAKPAAEHQWLQKFVGQWKAESHAVAGDGEPEIECQGEVSIRTIGGLWIVSEIKMTAMGQTTEALQTIGYDPDKEQFVGTWIDGMMTQLWHYTGTLDDSGKKLVLVSEGPNLAAPSTTAKYRDSYEFESDDEIIATSDMQGPDGKWVPFMKGRMVRKKAAAAD